MKANRVLVALAASWAPLVAQIDTITQARVREAVAWLAADERAGRDTGSPELEAAGAWLEARFRAAGLSPLPDGSFQHQFGLPGWRLDSRTVALQLARTQGGQTQQVSLVADTDVRLWTAADTLSGKDEACTVLPAQDPVADRLLLADAARRPTILEVPTDHPFWVMAAGEHQRSRPRRQASRPVFLVRAGLLPQTPNDKREATWTATWSVAAPAKVEVPQRNIVAVKPADPSSPTPDQYVVVSAHYDHIGIGQPVAGDAICNGADDNASGTTAVVLLAEALAKQPPLPRGVLFVCFTAEERRLLGSAAFCDRPPVPLDRIVANLNIEMIGRPEPGRERKAWFTGPDLSDFAAMLTPALARAGVEVVAFPQAAMLFAMSDNWSLAQRGIVAHSLSAGSLHRDYHQPSDEVELLDLAHMTAIVRGLYEATVELASLPAPPQWNERGKQRLQRARR